MDRPNRSPSGDHLDLLVARIVTGNNDGAIKPNVALRLYSESHHVKGILLRMTGNELARQTPHAPGSRNSAEDGPEELGGVGKR